jgi:hypothetical protein
MLFLMWLCMVPKVVCRQTARTCKVLHTHLKRGSLIVKNCTQNRIEVLMKIQGSNTKL